MELNKKLKDAVKIIAQKVKFCIKDVFSKCDHIRSCLSFSSHLLKKFFMENFIFCAVDLFTTFQRMF